MHRRSNNGGLKILMKRPHQVSAFLITLFYLMAVGSGACCCIASVNLSRDADNTHARAKSHDASHHENQHCHEDAQAGNSSHSHGDCNHSEIVAEIIGSNGLGLSASGSSYFPTSISISPVTGYPALIALFPLETGPPVFPNLLSISRFEILRI